jgi:hypothetical protein
VGYRPFDDSHSSDDDSTPEMAETTNEKPPVTTSATNKERMGKKPDKISTGSRSKQNSIISADLNADRCVFFSIDLEHGGDKAGILQLSMEAFTIDKKRLGEPFDRLGEPFDMYVKPPAGSTIPTAMTKVHGLSLSDLRIKNADGIEVVWPKFKQYIESKLDNGTKKASWWHGVENLATVSGSSVSLKWSTAASCQCHRDWTFFLTLIL